jgi:hypothetical protein
MARTGSQTLAFRLATASRFKGCLLESPIGRLGVIEGAQTAPYGRDVELVVFNATGTRLFVPLDALETVSRRRGTLNVNGDAAVRVTEPLRSSIAVERDRLLRTSAVERRSTGQPQLASNTAGV